jgi:hypothetical protein
MSGIRWRQLSRNGLVGREGKFARIDRRPSETNSSLTVGLDSKPVSWAGDFGMGTDVGMNSVEKLGGNLGGN